MTTAWSPKIEQLYENGVLINQTIQYAPQGVKEPYPQRTWVGLTWDDAPRGTGKSADWVAGARWAETILKEKNYG